MTIASDLLQQHIQTLVADNAHWQTLIADDLVWELPYAPAIGHPARLAGREEVVGFVTWFLGAVEQFRFFDLTVYACADPDAAVADEAVLAAPAGEVAAVPGASCQRPPCPDTQEAFTSPRPHGDPRPACPCASPRPLA